VPESQLPQAESAIAATRLRPEKEFPSSTYAKEENAPAPREGLPPTFRMRADRHYVDQMASQSVGVPVRLIPVNQIDPVQLSPHSPLVASITARGVVQPLLVRKRNGHYQVIAGRKRLVAAIAAGLTTVPCLLQEVNDAEAAELAAAENTRGGGSDSVSPLNAPVKVADLLQEIAGDLSVMNRSTALLKGGIAGKGGPAGSFHQKAAVDLIEAQAWRTAWLVNATTLLVEQKRQARRQRPLATIVERVLDGFEPETRLSGLDLKLSSSSLPPVAIDDSLGEIALTGAIFATLTWLTGVERPAIEIRAESSAADSLVLEVAQQSVSLSEDAERLFLEPGIAHRGNLVAPLAASVLRAVTGRYKGTAELVLDPGADATGSTIRCTFQI
jgi:hypothetical protein